jgi:hypothetical protein
MLVRPEFKWSDRMLHANLIVYKQPRVCDRLKLQRLPRALLTSPIGRGRIA